ncbi:MAG: TonB-dependent receptor [Candidatus Neomarinimicrobiota bacterium]
MRTVIGYSLILLLFTCSAIAQSQYIRGTIFDANSERPVEGANVFIKGTYVGTVSDKKGEFTLLWQGEFPITVYITYMGYEEYENTLPGYKNLSVALVPKVLEGEEIEISGARGVVERDVQSKVESVSLRRIEQRGIRDISEALQEMEAVTIQTTVSGKQYISIRGSNFNEVSVYLDGIRLNRAIDGAANLSSIDLSDLEQVEVIRGGTTTLFGSGNFGGVVLLHSKRPTENSLSVGRSIGITDDHDQDLTGNLAVCLGPVSMGGRYSGKSRLYDGRTLYTTIFTNAAGGLDFRNSVLSMKYFDISNYIEMPSGAIISSDEMFIKQVSFSGSIWRSTGWSMIAGERRWRFEDEFFSNIIRDFDDSSTLMRIGKSNKFKNINANIQYEEEHQKYSADQFITGIAITSLAWGDTAVLNQVDRGFAGVFRYQINAPTPAIDNFEIELGTRRSTQSYTHEQLIFKYQGPLVSDSTCYQFDSKVPLSTFRIGSTIEGSFLGQNIQVFFNQGYNHRAPTLNDRLLWGTTYKQTEELYNELMRTIPVSTEHKLLLENEQRDLAEVLNAMAAGLRKEYITSTELSSNIKLNTDKTKIFTNVEVGLSIFRNYYLDKIAYRGIQNNLTAPYNVQTASMNGFEVGGKFFSWDNLIQVNVNYTRIFPSDRNVFPNKPGTRANISFDFRKHWFHINLAHLYEGPQNYFRGGLSLQELDSQQSTNLTVSAHKQIWLFDSSVSYTIRNLFSDSTVPLQPGYSQMDYYDTHRQLLTIKFSLTGK